MKYSAAAAMAAVLSLTAFAAQAADAPEFKLMLKDHVFTPDTLEIPANTKVKLIVKNEDKTPEEFDSDDLHREKVIPGGGEAKILLGPLKAGEYKFAGEYNEKTAKGKVIVK